MHQSDGNRLLLAKQSKLMNQKLLNFGFFVEGIEVNTICALRVAGEDEQKIKKIIMLKSPVRSMVDTARGSSFLHSRQVLHKQNATPGRNIF